MQSVNLSKKDPAIALPYCFIGEDNFITGKHKLFSSLQRKCKDTLNLAYPQNLADDSLDIILKSPGTENYNGVAQVGGG